MQQYLDDTPSCSDCSLSNRCLPLGLTLDETEALGGSLEKQAVLKSGQQLFQSGDSFQGLFSVRSGAFKCSKLNKHGEESLIGFYLPGEILGFDALANQKYTASAIALGTSSACKISFEKLLKLATQLPHLQKQLFVLMSQAMNNQNTVTLYRDAHARLAGFLLDLSTRFKRLACSATHLELPMPRQDIALYLGLAPETISRSLAYLQNLAIIRCQKRTIDILDLPQLRSYVLNEDTEISQF